MYARCQLPQKLHAPGYGSKSELATMKVRHCLKESFRTLIVWPFTTEAPEASRCKKGKTLNKVQLISFSLHIFFIFLKTRIFTFVTVSTILMRFRLMFQEWKQPICCWLHVKRTQSNGNASKKIGILFNIFNICLCNHNFGTWFQIWFCRQNVQTIILFVSVSQN